MQSGFTKGGLSNHYRSQEVAVLREGPGMITEIVITGEEAVVEVLIGMIVTGMGRTGIIVAGAGAAVQVLITIGPEEEAVMVMSAKAEVDQLIVTHLLGIALVLAEALPHASLGLLGMKVLIGAAVIDGPQLLVVFRLEDVLLILEANPLRSQMMNDCCEFHGNSWRHLEWHTCGC